MLPIAQIRIENGLNKDNGSAGSEEALDLKII